MSRALIVIDIQNDYFADGKFPLWKPEEALAKAERAIAWARERRIPVVLVQHVASEKARVSPFFNMGTTGVEIHPRIRAAAPDAPVIVKSHADAFLKTSLEKTLSGFGATELLVCGMMTQNCVTHTAISKAAEKYDVTVLGDACTTVSEMIHAIALNALGARVRVASAAEVMAEK
jgi:nicotinamidase-related amidase